MSTIHYIYRTARSRGALTRRIASWSCPRHPRFYAQIPPSKPSPHPEELEHLEGTSPVETAVNLPGGANIGGGNSFKTGGRSPLTDAALTTVVGLGLVFFGGIAYMAWYKQNVLDKVSPSILFNSCSWNLLDRIGLLCWL